MSLRRADVERLVAPSFVEGLAEAPLSELRSRRDECLRAEVVLSYLRRILQGELDIVRAELELRSSGERSDPSRLVEDLPVILARQLKGEAGGGSIAERSATGDEGVARGISPPAHLSLVGMPGLFKTWSEPWTKEVEEMIAGALSSELVERALPGGTLPGENLAALSDQELAGAAARLEENEAVLSLKRRQLHERIDELQAAIVHRYQSGAASADSLLA